MQLENSKLFVYIYISLDDSFSVLNFITCTPSHWSLYLIGVEKQVEYC